MRVSNTRSRADRIRFYFSAEPPAFSVETEDGVSYWFELDDDDQMLALQENISVYLNRKFRLMKANEGKNAE